MKSSINKLVDYRTVPMDWEVPLSCPEEQIQKELRRVVRKHKTVCNVQTLEQGDVAMLKLQSDAPKFNKPMVPVTVGSNLLDAELESACIGRSVGETFTAETGAGKVTVTVLKASRTSYPEPTDAMVEEYCLDAEGYEGITTVEAFIAKVRADYCAELRESSVYEKQGELIEAVLTQSDWEFDDEDVNAMSASSMQSIKDELQEQEHKTLEELSEKELESYFEIGSLDELEREIKIDSERWIAMILWSAHESNKTPSLDDIDDLSFDFVEAFVRSKIVYKEEEA